MWKKSESEQPNPQPKPQPQPQPSAPARNPSPSSRERAIIGPSIEIKGNLTGGEDLLIEGRVEGKIELKTHNVTVGKSGKIKADIFGKMITIEGEVDGNLYGEDQLILRNGSSVRGNITAPPGGVILEDGSNFKGSIDMAPAHSSESKPVPAAGPQTPPAMTSGQTKLPGSGSKTGS
jgi:cytoskeletal protein CcmA (bactofilin family)